MKPDRGPAGRSAEGLGALAHFLGSAEASPPVRGPSAPRCANPKCQNSTAGSALPSLCPRVSFTFFVPHCIVLLFLANVCFSLPPLHKTFCPGGPCRHGRGPGRLSGRPSGFPRGEAASVSAAGGCFAAGGGKRPLLWPLPPGRHRTCGALSFSTVAFRRTVARPLRRTFLGHKRTKGPPRFQGEEEVRAVPSLLRQMLRGEMGISLRQGELSHLL